MILLEIPLQKNSADQTADIVLDSIPYTIRVLWNERFGYFSLSVSERDGTAILTNIKMVNNYPLVGRFKRLKIKGDLYFIHRGGKTYRPTYDDIGNDYGLFYYDAQTPISYPIPIAPRA